MVRLLGRPEEVDAWRRAQDRETWLMRWLAAKEAVRALIRTELRNEVHPRSLRLLELTDGFVVVEATELTSQQHLELLGPTRMRVTVQPEGEGLRATCMTPTMAYRG